MLAENVGDSACLNRISNLCIAPSASLDEKYLGSFEYGKSLAYLRTSPMTLDHSRF